MYSSFSSQENEPRDVIYRRAEPDSSIDHPLESLHRTCLNVVGSPPGGAKGSQLALSRCHVGNYVFLFFSWVPFSRWFCTMKMITFGWQATRSRRGEPRALASTSQLFGLVAWHPPVYVFVSPRLEAAAKTCQHPKRRAGHDLVL